MPASRPVPRARSARAEATQRALIAAAVKIIGRHGYTDASVARITQEAAVALGTFYTHFASQQQLFDELLPLVGQEMVAVIGTARRAGGDNAAVRERHGLEAFFDYLLDVPEFYRILVEAETFAPAGHAAHTRNMLAGIVRSLARARTAGQLAGYEPRELEVVGTMMLGIRHYLAMHYGYDRGQVARVPGWVVDCTMKLLGHGLFRDAGTPPDEPPRRRSRRGAAAPRLVRRGVAEATLEAMIGADDEAALCRLVIAAARATFDGELTLAGLQLNLVQPGFGGRLQAVATIGSAAGDVALITVRVLEADAPVGQAQVELRKKAFFFEKKKQKTF